MSKILLTGATGYIGGKLLGQLLKDRTESFLIPMRPSSKLDFESRKATFLAKFTTEDQKRIEVLPTDLSGLVSSLDSQKPFISVIIHNAAKTAFNVDEMTANVVNRDASLDLLEFARTCPHLKQFLYVSTLYTAGLTAGPIQEKFFDRPLFANHYERSKWEVEETLRTQYSDVPWKIGRVATVIADSESGYVVQQNAIHNTLKLFYYGLISLLPGFPETPVHLVDGDFVAASLSGIISRGEVHQIYHVCYGQESSIQLGRFIDVAFDEFNQDENFKIRRLLKPLFTDEKSFDVLVANVQGFGGSVLNQGLSSISPFGRQLFVKKEVDNSAMKSIIENYQNPDMELMVRKACQYLSKTKFSKAKEL